MEKRVEDEVVYYYDSHPTEEDLMGETSVHAEAEIRQAQTSRVEALAEKLRSLGIDPDQL